jgi:hypothetical protein
MLAFLVGCARLQPVNEQEKVFQKIYYVPGLSKKQIHEKSVEWMAKTFVSSKAVIEVNNPDTGKIVGNGITHFTNAIVQIPCEYSMTIDSKDGKFRVTFDNYVALWGVNHERRLPLVEKAFVGEVNQNFMELSDSLMDYMKKTKDDNW